MDRRKFVKMAGVAAAAGATGCVGGGGNGGDGGNGDGGEDGGGGGNGGDGGNGDGGGNGGADPTVGQDGNAADMTGQSEVTVDVGAGDGFKFNPADIIIDAGTTVRWVWTGNGGQHNVTQSDGDETVSDPMFESELTGEEGHEFTHTFEDPGTVDYVCTVHINQGMIGSVQVEGNGGGGGNGGDGMDGNETDGGMNESE